MLEADISNLHKENEKFKLTIDHLQLEINQKDLNVANAMQEISEIGLEKDRLQAVVNINMNININININEYLNKNNSIRFSKQTKISLYHSHHSLFFILFFFYKIM
jgi:hypothetical protein